MTNNFLHKGRPALLLLFVICLVACSSPGIMQEHQLLADRRWDKDSALVFALRVPDNKETYDLGYIFRHTNTYPFYNLYIQSTIYDSLGNSLHRDLNNFILFDKITGEPRGSGIGDIFEVQLPALQAFTFPFQGRYTLELKQYMRLDSVPGLISVGIQLDYEGEEK